MMPELPERPVIKRIPLAPMVVFCNSDTYIFFPATPWMDAVELEMLRDALETRNMPGSNNMTIQIGLQTCQTPDAPDTPVAQLASVRTTDGLTFPVAFADKTATTGAKQLARLGYLAKNTNTSDTTLRHAWVCGRVESQKK
jgi:hypothetical protein